MWLTVCQQICETRRAGFGSSAWGNSLLFLYRFFFFVSFSVYRREEERLEVYIYKVCWACVGCLCFTLSVYLVLFCGCVRMGVGEVVCTRFFMRCFTEEHQKSPCLSHVYICILGSYPGRGKINANIRCMFPFNYSNVRYFMT